MSAGFAFEAIAPEDAFTSLGAGWREILAASPADTIFLTPEWMEAWWSVYGAGRRGAVVAVRRGSELVALAPLQVATERWRGAASLRTLRFLGDGTYDSDYLDLIAAPGLDGDLVPSLWHWLRRGAPFRFDLARWNEIPAAAPSAARFEETLRRGRTLIERERVGAVYATLPGSWDDYLAGLKPRMRTKVRSLRRDLEGAHAVRLLACEREADLDERLESLFDLHERRWSARGAGGVFRGERKRRFYHRLSRVLLERGWLQFHSLEVDGAWVAHQYCMGYRGAVYLLQEGYDPAWEPSGVGNVLRAMVLQRLIESGWGCYDFLAGVTDHKRSWGGAVKESVRLFARGPSLAGFGVAALERGARAFRARLRRSPAPEGAA